MSAGMIDALARRTATLTRRTALGAALGGLVGSALAVEAEAKSHKKRHKRRKRKNRVTANAFGCLNVGDRCDGTSLECCSGICQKEKGGKGKPRKSFCAAHDEGSCRPDQDVCTDGDEAAAQCDVTAVCFKTTGQAGFCGLVEAGECFSCRLDADCEPEFGAGAACVVCTECLDEDGGRGTGCVPPATGQLPN